MKVKFYKFQATGNDFIMFNGFGEGVNLTLEQIRFLCDRHFGVGSDGLIILRPHQDSDFFMEFYNPDGSIASFCGNGSRCAVLFAYYQGLIQDKTKFAALDGLHTGEILGQNLVKVKMIDTSMPERFEFGLYLNTGTHHVVSFVDDVESLDIVKVARPVRYAAEFEPEGTNVNFVQILAKSKIKIRTYEKGVEAETLSCGTGTVASALAAAYEFGFQSPMQVETRGGKLEVSFEQEDGRFKNVFLKGPVKMVFTGEINLK